MKVYVVMEVRRYPHEGDTITLKSAYRTEEEAYIATCEHEKELGGYTYYTSFTWEEIELHGVGG